VLFGKRKSDIDIGLQHILDEFRFLEFFALGDIHLLVNVPPVTGKDVSPASCVVFFKPDREKQN